MCRTLFLTLYWRLQVFVNDTEVFRPLDNANNVTSVNNIAGNPGSEFMPLQRCEGDCDDDSDCDSGLFCLQHNNMEALPGCSGSRNSAWDYCVDLSDFDYGFTLLPTGGWDDDWHVSSKLPVDLNGE